MYSNIVPVFIFYLTFSPQGLVPACPEYIDAATHTHTHTPTPTAGPVTAPAKPELAKCTPEIWCDLAIGIAALYFS